jgi:hypothetical protein
MRCGALTQVVDLYAQPEGSMLKIRKGIELVRAIDMSDGQDKELLDVRINGWFYGITVKLSVEGAVEVKLHNLRQQNNKISLGTSRPVPIREQAEEVPAVPAVPAAATPIAPVDVMTMAVGIPEPDDLPFASVEGTPSDADALALFAHHTPYSKVIELATGTELGDKERLLWKQVANFIYKQRKASPYYEAIRKSTVFGKILDEASLSKLVQIIEATK